MSCPYLNMEIFYRDRAKAGSSITPSVKSEVKTSMLGMSPKKNAKGHEVNSFALFTFMPLRVFSDYKISSG